MRPRRDYKGAQKTSGDGGCVTRFVHSDATEKSTELGERKQMEFIRDSLYARESTKKREVELLRGLCRCRG